MKKMYLSVLLLLFLSFNSCSTHKPFIVPTEWKTSNMSIDEIKNYLQKNKKSISLIEGIWQVSNNFSIYSRYLNTSKSGYNPNAHYVAIIKENIYNSNETRYLIVMIQSGRDDWDYPRRIKGYIQQLNKNSYTISWYNPYYKPVYAKMHFNSYGELLGKIEYEENDFVLTDELSFTKIFPNNEISPSIKENNKVAKSGSGVLISKDGLVLTNSHIINGANEILVQIPTKNTSKYASVIFNDINNDIAVLKLLDFQYDSIYFSNIPFSFADISKTKLGEEVFAVGYPLGALLGNTPRVSNGIINSLFGINDDPRLFQISNPLQPGNSGSPLFNNKGEILGLVVSSLDAKYFYDNLGIIPQNVNFVIKNNFIKNLLESLPHSSNIENPNILYSLSMEKQIEIIQPYILKINAISNNLN